MFKTLREISIRQLIRLLRHYQVPEQELAVAVRHSFIVFNCLLNAIAAAGCGYVTAFYLRGDTFAALKVSACMISVGYRLRLIPGRNHANLIVSLLTRDSN